MLKKTLIEFRDSVDNCNWIWFPPLLFALTGLIIYLSDSNLFFFQIINSGRNQYLEFFWANINILGDAFFIVVIQLLWIRRRPEIVWSSVFAAFPAFLISHGIKVLLSIPRPAGTLPQEMINILGPVFTQNSFPSGHATTVFTVAGVWILCTDSVSIKYISLFSAFMIGYSRIVAGVHWPVDIMGGAIIGWISACAGIVIYSKFRWSRKRLSINILTVLLIAAGIVLLFQYDTGFEQAVIFHRVFAGACVITGTISLMLNFRNKELDACKKSINVR